MGQHFILANHSKKEYIHPHDFDEGLNLWEICADGGFAKVAMFLMADGDDDGGASVGRWAGDRVTLVGDYQRNSKGNYTGLYKKVKRTYKNVSLDVGRSFNAYMNWPDASVSVRETMSALADVETKHTVRLRKP